MTKSGAFSEQTLIEARAWLAGYGPSIILAINVLGTCGRRLEMASVRKPEGLYTEDEYLPLERASHERREYLDGLIYLMAGESLEHGDICMNLSRIVSTSLLGSPCRALWKDNKVRSAPIPKSRDSAQRWYSVPDL